MQIILTQIRRLSFSFDIIAIATFKGGKFFFQLLISIAQILKLQTNKNKYFFD